MNDDLISRSKLIEDIEKMVKEQCMSNPNITLLNAGEIIDKIYEQPTAFDVDKVIEQLEKQVYEIDDSLSLSARDVIDEEDVFEIVKAGGIDG